MDKVLALSGYVFIILEALWLSRCININLKRYHYMIYGIIILIGIVVCFNKLVDTVIIGSIDALVAYAIFFLMLDEGIFQRIEYCILIVLMKSCILLSVETWFTDRICLDINTSITDSIVMYIVEFLIIIALGCFIRLFLDKIFNEQKLRIGEVLDSVIILGAINIFICIFCMFNLIRISYFQGFVVKAVVSMGGISLLLLEINILYKKWLTHRATEYAKAEHELSEMQKKYYISLLDKEAETKKYRHDMNNHMICIRNMLDEKRYTDLDKYINNLYDQTSFLVNKGYKTGNGIIDALTNYYVDNLNKEIQFELKGLLTKELNIDDTSLSSIYSNMLINAIEAQKYIPSDRKKYIYVTLKEGEKFAQIIVRNSMVDEHLADVDNITTTKPDKDNHGFGITNIRKNVAEHEGKLLIETGDYEFCIKVTFNIN